jgi:hypothetical protein
MLDARETGDAMYPEFAVERILAAWERDRERMAVVTAQRDALAPWARYALAPTENPHVAVKQGQAAGLAALAGIRAEQDVPPSNANPTP